MDPGWRVEDLFFELVVVLADHGDLQFLTRAKVGEDAGLAHAGHFRQGPDGQPFEPHMRGQTQGGLQDGTTGLLPLVLHRALRLLAARRLGVDGGIAGVHGA